MRSSRSNFIEGFKQALEAALALHEGYPKNKASLAAKTGPEPIKKTPEAFPALLRYSATLDLIQKLTDRASTATKMALNVETVSRRSRRSSSETNAQKAGIRRGDIVVGYGDRTDRLTESGIIAYVLQDKTQAKTLPVKLLRNGKRVEVELSLE